MSKRSVVLPLTAALAAALLAGCANAAPSYPPPAGPPGPKDGSDWPVVGNGPSQDATQAYLDNPAKLVQPDVLESGGAQE
ncbi:MAG: hypothetical protein HY876_01945 [Coriobacteriales bacterium]|nr:hypothetical protein [Coriobacteriales bacterium]